MAGYLLAGRWLARWPSRVTADRLLAPAGWLLAGWALAGLLAPAV